MTWRSRRARSPLIRVPSSSFSDGALESPSGAHEDEEALGARDGRVEKAPMQQQVVRGVESDDDRGILAALRAVHRDAPRRDDVVDFRPGELDLSHAESHVQLDGVRFDRDHAPGVAVVELEVVVVAQLQDLRADAVAGAIHARAPVRAARACCRARR